MKNSILLSANNCNVGGLHYTTNHTGKMAGLYSLSTSPLNNINCIRRRASGASVCSHCFAVALMARYKNVNPLLVRNGELLSTTILPFEDLPVIPVRFFRFEAFGDLINENQVINYFNIARKNPDTLCALWTKNPVYIKKAIEAGHEKPANLQIVYSSPRVNSPVNIEALVGLRFVDKVFTVYSPEYIEQRNVNINCGARSCAACGLCYHKNPAGVPVVEVREKLK